jgi:serine/threonine protein phosphatase PrpC
VIRSQADLDVATRTHGGISTYVVGLDGWLRVAPRESEHIACAGAPLVLTAGELVSAAGRVEAATNLSTGFCPREDSYEALDRALRIAGIEPPGAFEPVFAIRRCDACGARCVIKEGMFDCSECDTTLSATWNFDPVCWHRRFINAWHLDVIAAPAMRDEDRFGVDVDERGVRIALADGAGGMTGGRSAANFAVRESLAHTVNVARVSAIDAALMDQGQTTLVALDFDLTDGSLRGASVGDSRAWAATRTGWVELSEGQSRKPLVGSGSVRPHAFSAAHVHVLCLTSDGLGARRTEGQIWDALQGEQDLVRNLVDSVRLPDGRLEDDVSLVVLRRAVDPGIADCAD